MRHMSPLAFLGPRMCSDPGATPVALPTLNFEVTFAGFSQFSSAMQAAYKNAIVAATAGEQGSSWGTLQA